MIPLIERELVEKKKWVNREEITDILAVSESIPGAIAINLSTFMGYKICGRKGAIAAATGVIMPSFIVITLIATFFSKFGDNEVVKAVFAGIRPAVVALIAIAAFNMSKASIKDMACLVVTVVSVIAVVVFDVHAIFAIVGAAIFGLLVYKFWPAKVKQIIGKGAAKGGTKK
jgi:chromate transporter